MKYNFDEIVDRNHSRSARYDGTGKKFGSQDAISLWIADMDFKTTQPVIGVSKARAEEGIWGRTSHPDSYYETMCGWQKRRNGWNIDKGMISFNLRVVPVLSSMVYVFTEPGDKVPIQTPVYPRFYDMTESQDREVVGSSLKEQDGHWAIDFEDFEEKAREAKIFFLRSSHNPLGIVQIREELERICNICIANDMLIVSDEIHSDLVSHRKKHTPTATLLPEITAHIISCIPNTKIFSLAGPQASATIFPNRKLKARLDKFWFNLDIHHNNAFGTIATEVAFNEGKEWLKQLLGYIGRGSESIKGYCAASIPQVKPNVPGAAYLVWLNCRGLSIGNEELRSFTIHEADLELNEGWSFGHGLSGFMRLNAVCPHPVLEKTMEQLRHIVDERNT